MQGTVQMPQSKSHTEDPPTLGTIVKKQSHHSNLMLGIWAPLA
jgi:hypothetical protein